MFKICNNCSHWNTSKRYVENSNYCICHYLEKDILLDGPDIDGVKEIYTKSFFGCNNFKHNKGVAMKTHELKILPLYFKAVIRLEKTFEYRLNDRNFKQGDTVILKEFDGRNYTGREAVFEIGFILESTENKVILSILNLQFNPTFKDYAKQ